MSFESLVKKLVKEGKSETAAKKIAGSVANAKMKGAGSGPTAAQKAISKGPKKIRKAAGRRKNAREAAEVEVKKTSKFMRKAGSKASGGGQDRNAIKGPKMKSDSKDFKPHSMYGSGGVVKFVKTMKEHLALKAKGYGHTKKK